MTLVHSPSAHTQPGKSKTVADILTAAADLIEPEGRWTQRGYAKSETGREVSHRSPLAVCWCADGALWALAPKADQRWDAENALRSIIRSDGSFCSIETWNDAPERTQAEVVAALRAAAEKARTALPDTQPETPSQSPGDRTS